MFTFLDRFDEIDGGDMTLRVIEKNPGGGAVLPFYYYDIFVENVAVGKISIRIGDDFHTYYNGHIGYEINEEARGHGYTRRACELVLSVARAHGMSRLYVTCTEDNAPSYRTIEKLGGSLLEICDVPREYFAWFEGIKRHRIYQVNL